MYFINNVFYTYILFYLADYKIAHDKATLALDTSDLNTHTETTGKKRKRKYILFSLKI